MAEQMQDANPPEKHFDDHSVIVPQHKLKQVVTHARGSTQIDMSAIDRAENALDEIRSQFPEWMNMECQRIDTARKIIHEQGLTRATVDALFMPAHDIKGGATTLGFPLAERIATSLCRLLKHVPEPARLPRNLIDHHVDAIRAVVREDVKDVSNPYGVELAERLSIMTETFLAAELKEGYAKIAGDAAPRLVLPKVPPKISPKISLKRN
ncbi:MAG: Hpt domain-containing protein [Rhizobiales bacterium]|nr:Hpt domain-containing protein [Hyphomicrobiales bacterium]